MTRRCSWPFFALFLAVLLALGAACSPQEEQPQASELALLLTASAVPVAGASPVTVATPVSVDAMAATATRLAEELQATATAAAAEQSQAALDKLATEEPVRRELATYGVLEGRLTGLYDPVTLEETEEESYSFYEPNFAAQARDFVIVADITWNSATEDSGCGFVFRSNGDQEALDQYIMGVTRGAELLFTEQIDGNVDSNQVLDIDLRSRDPQFQIDNDTTNRIAVVGRGQQFTLYSNGKRLDTITARSNLEDGFVTFIAVNQSGGIRCQFDNAWLWEMN